VRAGRLATTVKKRFVFSVVDKRTSSIHYLVSKWWKA
jgi:tRNA splicing endonuclease